MISVPLYPRSLPFSYLVGDAGPNRRGGKYVNYGGIETDRLSMSKVFI